MVAARFVCLASLLAAAGCSRQKEFSADEVRSALRADHWSLTERGADRRVTDPSIATQCFDVAKAGTRASVCVWRCSSDAECNEAYLRVTRMPGNRKSHDTGSSWLIEDGCRGSLCNELQGAYPFTRW